MTAKSARPPKRAADGELQLASILETYLAASKAVWNDGAVWIEERDRADCKSVAWPRSVQGTRYEMFLADLLNAVVDVVLTVLRMRDHPASPALPPNVNDPAMQIVLRVVARAHAAGTTAMEVQIAPFDGARVTGLRDYKNQFTEKAVDFLLRHRLRAEFGDRAFDIFGISRAAAFRAMKRRR